jgi:hypothetical protein
MTRNAGYGTGGSPFKPASQQPALHRLVPDLVGEPHLYPTVRVAVAAAAAGEEQH